MRLQDKLADGTRIVAITPAEWDALASATEIAFEDEDPIPAHMRAVAASLYEVFHTPAFTPPVGWTEAETGGGCTAFYKEVNGAEMFITTILDPRAPSRPTEQSVLGLYRTGAVDAYVHGEDLLTCTGTAEQLLKIGDRFGFIGEGVPFFAFPEAGSFLAVSKHGDRVLLYCPMNADGSPDISIGEVENSEGIDFDDVNSIFGTSFNHGAFQRRR